MRISAPRLFRRIATCLAFALLPMGAWAQAAPPATPRAVAPDPAFEAARTAFETLPESERKAVQEALIWVGDYAGLADGSFGRQTYDALLAYQRRGKAGPDGILDAKARAALQKAGQQAREAAGFQTVEDERSGVRIGVPGRLLTKREPNQSGGTRWQSADDKVTLDTRSLANETLQSLYDRNLAIRTPGRQVTYKVLRPDFFVIAGETPTGKFYTRMASGEAGLRGFSIGYDKSLAHEVDPLVVAIANSFTPLSARSAPVAEANTAPAAPARPAPDPAAPATPAQTVPSPAAAVAISGLLGTGLAVGPHRVVTTAAVEGCSKLRVGGLRPRERKTRDPFTVLEFAETLRYAPLRIEDRPSGAEPSLLALAFARPGDRDELVVTPAQAEGGATIFAPLQPGAAGAPVFDRSGALRGLVRPGTHRVQAVAGVVPPARHALQSAGLAEFIDASGGADSSDTALSAADLAARRRDSVLALTCEP